MDETRGGSPLLVSMLTDYLPSEQVPFLEADQAWFDEERIRVALTLGFWDDASFVPVFRQAYHLHVKAEQYRFGTILCFL